MSPPLALLFWLKQLLRFLIESACFLYVLYLQGLWILGNSIMFSPCLVMFSWQCYITVISCRDQCQARPGCITCANFILREGREPDQWSYSDGCSDSDVVTLAWPLISLLSPRLHFKSVCHEHHQVTLSSVTKWENNSLTRYWWVLVHQHFFLFRISLLPNWICLERCSWQPKLGRELMAWKHGLWTTENWSNHNLISTQQKGLDFWW